MAAFTTKAPTRWAALLDTLEEALGCAFTPEVRDAWATLYAVVARSMQCGAALAETPVLNSLPLTAATHQFGA